MNRELWRFNTSGCWVAGVAFALATVVGTLSGCGFKADTNTKPGGVAVQNAPAESPDVVASSSETPVKKTASAVELYAQHCAACHGTKGDATGLAAKFVFPKPRDFRAGRFRLVSTSNGIPTPDDIAAVVRRGMPGSSMPPWSHLGDDAVKMLTEHVLALRRDGAREVVQAAAKESEDELSPEELQATVARLTTAGDVVVVPDLGQPTPAAIAHGKALYTTKGCLQCHGATGKGDGQQVMVDSEGLPTRPRDLTRGIFKGSPDVASVWRRISTGMPGTPMPSSQSLTPQEVGDLTHFVLSLSDDEVRKEAVLTRQQIIARQVEALPTSIDSPIWLQSSPIAVRTVPLWWRDNAEPALLVQALQDGTSISLRLTWSDSHADQDAVRSEDFEDAIAVELFRGDSEPFFGMGAAGAPIDMWFWDADRQSKTDVENANPGLIVDIYPLNEALVGTAEYDRPGTRRAAQPPVTLPAVATGNEIVPGKDTLAASSLEVAGPGSVTFRPVKSQLVQAHGQWADGRWTVMMTRTLQVDSPASGVSLEPGAKVSVAFAIWDGDAKDRDGKKMVSIWQDLELERK